MQILLRACNNLVISLVIVDRQGLFLKSLKIAVDYLGLLWIVADFFWIAVGSSEFF